MKFDVIAALSVASVVFAAVLSSAGAAQASATLNVAKGYAGDGGTAESNGFYVLDVAESPASSGIVYQNDVAVADLDDVLSPGVYTFSAFWNDCCTTGSGNQTGTATFSFDGSGVVDLSATAAYASSLSSAPSFSGVLSYYNGTDTVTISKFVEISNGLAQSLSIPSVNGDGSLSDSPQNITGFQVTFDVVDGSGAPEPSTWALMLLGIGGLGASLRRRARLAHA